MKTFEQHLHDSGTGGYPLRDILDNLTDEEIEDSVKEYARDYAQKACEYLRERIAESAFEMYKESGFTNTGIKVKQSILNTEIILP